MSSAIRKWFDYLYLRRYGVTTRLGYVTLRGLPIIQRHPDSRIILDRGVTLTSGVRQNCAGINHPVILATLAAGACLHIRQGSGMSGGSIVCVERVDIGENCGLGVNCSLYETDFHPVDFQERMHQTDIKQARHAPIVIGNHVWLGGNVVVLKGVEIGDGAVVACNAVVTRTVPAGAMVAGNPAHGVGEPIKGKV